MIVNGVVTATREVEADGQVHELSFPLKVERSSWVAIRHFPQMHANPVTVTVGGQPIRASRTSALWCVACIEQLWRARGKAIAEKERDEAQKTFQRMIDVYRRIADEAN